MTKKILIFTMSVFCAVCLFAQNQQEANDYLNEQIAVLNGIQALTVQETQQLESAFWARWQEHPRTEIAFQQAMSEVLTNEQHFREYFADQIERRAWIIFNDDLNHFRHRQRLPENSLERIKPILRQRSQETAFYEYRFIADFEKRGEAIAAVRDKHRESLSRVTMRENASGVTHNLRLVLDNREMLGLTDAQVDAIIASAQKIRQLTRDGEITRELNNRWLFEREFIMQHLTSEQVDGFVAIRSHNAAQNFAEHRWREMEERNIAFLYDSAATVNEIIAYQIAREVIQYVYMENPERQQELNDKLDKTSFPIALAHLRVNSPKLRFILDNRERLRLNSEQFNAIIATSQKIHQLVAEQGEVTREERRMFEREFIMQILTERQVAEFVAIRTYDSAKNFAENRWQEMKERNIAFLYDSTQTVNEIIAHQITRERIQYIYMENFDRQQELNDYLRQTAYPRALAHLRVNSPNFRLVLDNRARLRLTHEQFNAIIDASRKVRQLSREGEITREENNRWLFEREFIMQILTEEQVADFVTIRNFDNVRSTAERNWREMEEFNIAFEYDSATVVRQIIAYQLARERIRFVHLDNPDMQRELDRYLYRSSFPRALRHLRVERRRQASQENEDKDALIF